MATHKVSPPSPHAQFPAANNLDIREIADESFALANGCPLHMAVIQEPVRKWERPWLHRRAIVLFTKSREETKLRIQAGWLRAGEMVLQIVRVGE